MQMRNMNDFVSESLRREGMESFQAHDCVKIMNNGTKPQIPSETS